MTLIQKIKYQLKGYLNKIHNEKVKINILQAIPFWTASIITGLVAILYAKLFALAERGTSYILHYHQSLIFLLTPICFMASWWLVKRFSAYARGSGIPQVMAAIELSTPKKNVIIDKLLSVKVIFVKVLSSLIMVFGGGLLVEKGLPYK